ncbi:MAG: 2-amino-4-hydroxy-6-hydroxymethyldihydropteridine diphosphokinase [Planctomycetaceae bacterium]
MATCGIALGGNIGDTATMFELALSRLNDSRIHVRRMSSILRSRAMGSDAGDDFLNAAAVVETSLHPVELLQQLHRIETDLGRKRQIRWGPRLIDLDLLLYDQQIIDTDSLVIPHPAMWYRRFVLEPLAQVAPELPHPILNESVRELCTRLDQRPLRIALSGISRADIAFRDLQSIVDQQFGSDKVELTHSFQISDAIFAVLKLEIRDGERDTRRTQPAHEPDRTIPVLSESGNCRLKLIETLTDVCSAAIG